MSQQATFQAPGSSRSAFISHASADAELAQQLCAQLESQGIRCWVAPRDVTPGNPYSSEIVHGIEGTDALILLATPAAVTSENVLNELEQAHRLHKTLLTVMIGKPEISRQLSYYIARLHWIEAVEASIAGVADRLAQALHGTAPWEKVASKPSVSRWFSYGLWRLFLVPAASVLAVLLLAGLGTAHFLRGRLATDYRSLGWLTLDGAQDSSGAPIRIGARVWIADDGTPLSDVTLRGTLRQKDQSTQGIDLSDAQKELQSGSGQAVLFAVPSDASQLTTCLAVPSAKPGGRYRVTQNFAITAAAGGDSSKIAPGAVSVKKEDGSPCGS